MWPVTVGLYLALGAASAEFLLNPERFQGNVHSPIFLPVSFSEARFDKRGCAEVASLKLYCSGVR